MLVEMRKRLMQTRVSKTGKSEDEDEDEDEDETMNVIG